MILRRLTLSDEQAFFTALNAWDGSTGFMFAYGYKPDMNFADYIRRLAQHEIGEELPEGHVPSTSLCGFVGNEIVGRLGLRHALNDFLLKIGGHIGYGVLPAFRRKGYAKAMLAQALPMAKSLGISRALITCDDDNLGSIKTIEACHGVLENKVEVDDGKPLKRRYWVDL